MKKFRLLFIFILIINSCLLISQNSDFKKLLKKAGEYVHKGAQGNKKAVGKAEKVLEKIIRQKPAFALSKSLLGTVYTLKGRDANSPWEKMEWVKKGIKLFEKSVKLDSTNIWVRFERGINSLYLPSFFNRLGVAKKDFDFIINQIEQKTDSYILNSKGTFLYKKEGERKEDFVIGTKQMIYLNAGEVYYKLSNPKKALKLWEKFIKLRKKSEYANKAQKNIKNMEK